VGAIIRVRGVAREKNSESLDAKSDLVVGTESCSSEKMFDLFRVTYSGAFRRTFLKNSTHTKKSAVTIWPNIGAVYPWENCPNKITGRHVLPCIRVIYACDIYCSAYLYLDS